jgi:hypothetical protein
LFNGASPSNCRLKSDILRPSRYSDRLGRPRPPERPFALESASLGTVFPDNDRSHARLKTLLRKAAERSVEATWRRIGASLDCFTPSECAHYLANAGYACGADKVSHLLRRQPAEIARLSSRARKWCPLSPTKVAHLISRGDVLQRQDYPPMLGGAGRGGCGRVRGRPSQERRS